MFSIQDGRKSFYQWDKDRKLIVNDESITEVHFCNRTDTCSLIVETYTEDGVTLANVPNLLLTTAWKIHVYGYDTNHTKYEKCFDVISRTKPADYVYTETELKDYADLAERIKALEEKESGVSKEYVDDAIGDIEVAIDEIIALQELYIKANAADIKFYIDGSGNEYTTKEFSTWKDYFSIQENVDNIGFFDYGDGLVRIYGGVFWLLYNDGTTVKPTDEIIANYNYSVTNV